MKKKAYRHKPVHNLTKDDFEKINVYIQNGIVESMEDVITRKYVKRFLVNKKKM